jgi:hypothetical protein
LQNTLDMMHFDKGRTIWLELKIEDSFLSSLLYRWMFAKSKFDSGAGLHALGASIQSIMYQKPSGYPPEVKAAVSELYKNMFGDNPNP